MSLTIFTKKGWAYTEKELEKPIEVQTKALIEIPTVETIKEPEATIEDSKEEPIEVSIEEEPIEKPIKKQYRKFLMGGIILLFTFLVIYLGMTLFFMNHFYLGTKINGINVSGKTLEDVKEIMTAELKAYTLNIKERGGNFEQIKGPDVGLKYSSDEEVKKFKDSQKGFRWVAALLNAESLKKTVVFTYNKRLLKERINQLACFKPEYIVESKNPTFKYVDNSYVIVNEVLGNKVDKDILYSHVVNSIRNGEAEIDLTSTGCYVLPQYDAKSPTIVEAKNTLNKYVATKITYTYGNRPKTLDGSKIKQWLTYDEKFKVTFNKEKVKAYINELANTYNTVGKTRNFITSSGKTIKIGGGDYGRSINKVKETQNLISAIKAGKTVTKEPVFSQNAFSHGNNDIGNTYVELSIAKQHLWFYKNGSLIVQGNVVTGNVREDHSTHKGIYSLKYKARNVVLRGQDYAAPVTFWMPFDGGIGIHDASWRSVFGGNIYKFNGSHGCVNSPYYVAKKIFNNITPGTPVIVY